MASPGRRPGWLARARAVLDQSRQRSAEGHLPVARQVGEMAWLRLTRGIGPAYYQLAGFWRRDMPWRVKAAHIGVREYRRRLARLNPEEYRKLSQHKVAEKAILALFGVPTPRFLGCLHRHAGRAAGGAALATGKDLEALLESVGLPRVCFKPVEGWGGAGFRAVELASGPAGLLARPLSGGPARPLVAYVDEDLLPAGDSGWIVEEYVDQHERCRAFNPSSLNTMRLWVLRRGGEPARVLGGFLRIGRAGSLVDNVAAGGILARIDLATGVLDAAIDRQRRTYRVHPDHGAPIEGRVVPCWPEAAALACETLPLFPHLRFAGFDVAVSRQGPLVIELNVTPDLQGAAEAGIPLRRILLP